MIFDKRLTELRKAKGLNQKECALELGMPDASKYNKWENGANRPDYETVCRLAKYFGVTTDYLLGASDCKSLDNDIIHKETGLSEKAIETLKRCIDVDKQNSITLTINTLLENRFVLFKIAQYLYYELEKDEKAELMDNEYDETGDKYRIVPYTIEYKYKSSFGAWGDDEKFPIDADIAIAAITPKTFKKITLLELNDELEKLLEQESKINHFEK